MRFSSEILQCINACPLICGNTMFKALGTMVSSAGNVDRVGWDYPLTDPSTVAVLRDQT
jgi:hypothetical protein